MTLVIPTGFVIDTATEALRLPDKVSLADLCGCGQHVTDIKPQSYMPHGIPLLRWKETSPVRQVRLTEAK